jgi:hypothetical protein
MIEYWLFFGMLACIALITTHSRYCRWALERDRKLGEVDPFSRERLEHIDAAERKAIWFGRFVQACCFAQVILAGWYAYAQVFNMS